jgi:hypothetical protein
LIKAYDLESEEANCYRPKKIGLRDGEIVLLQKLTQDLDVECNSLKEEAWETHTLMEENGNLVDMVEICITR